MLASCQPEELGITTSTQSFSIKHENASFHAPSIECDGVVGKIAWGDGAEDKYSSWLIHTYESAGPHTVTIKLSGGNSFELSSLAGVSEIDIAKF